MHWLGVVALSLMALAAAAAVQQLTGVPTGRLMVIASSGWAAFDSMRLRFRHHRDCEAYHPLIVYLLVGQLWPVTFPYYLLLRRRIRRGTLVAVPPFHPDDVVY
ncbi:MAG TPA: hypothetical protein VMT11_03570 [Myxococcaceae bacterium]|nr:hypothetical protein [Myxococcaceae bacterium]